MPPAHCFNCRDDRHCPTCRGYGKRVRVAGVWRWRRQVVECKECLGTGLCLVCKDEALSNHGGKRPGPRGH